MEEYKETKKKSRKPDIKPATKMPKKSVINIKKPVKKQRQEEDFCAPNKKIKIEESVSADNANIELLELSQKDFNKTKVKQDIKNEERVLASSSFAECSEWTTVDYMQEVNNVEKNIAENLVKLFDEDHTIPFIARYRRGVTGSMTPDQLRILKDSYEQVKVIKHRAATIIKAIDKLGKWSLEVHSAITSAKSLGDLEDIYSLYKPASKRLADKAMELGLGPVSHAVLHGREIPPLASLIDEGKKGLRNKDEVMSNVVCLTAHIISKDKRVFDRAFSLRKTTVIEIHTTLCKTSDAKSAACSASEQKYEQYFDFKMRERNIKPHQILAINRAESQKVIKVKIVIPDALEQQWKKYCLSLYTHQRQRIAKAMIDLLNESIDYAYKKMMKPLIKRRLRSELKERAETASINVFATNVKQLLLTPPVRGKVILGIDPGFRHGCKLAVVSEHGDVLETAVIYPHNQSGNFEHSANALAKLVKKHRCSLLALGNGTACRETEQFLTRIRESNAFDFKVTYTIVNESGASVYSCSPEAKSEFLDLDPNLVSAVSIARRLQDPLAELVKVEPKHLGVGMYQHDLPEKQLLNTLDEVVTEAVSFVGVDINTASQCLLRRIAGLTNSRAASIINWRTNHGPFKNRKQLLKVKGIGSKTFEQCAGFIRILPETAAGNEKKTEKNVETKSKKARLKDDDLNPLDQTWIHPESYAIATEFIKYCQCKLDDLGTPEFIERIKFCAQKERAELVVRMDTTESTMEVIVEALTMKRGEDIRLKLNSPLFRDSMRSLNDLSIGVVLSGAVQNVTHFGAFVDIGVGTNGLIHNSKMKNQALCVGQRVEVKVIDIESSRKRIGLELEKTL
ncbi:hypothetical protein DMN91_011350 [Ooceraea biroi]|uniref:S1 RNA-binding domain-containing protein n=1 Tax=Ooceraea biroi TaxID=2015173 RepID=A0A026WA20_OOCBI|nr:S1 RNA-binding domain-containing protein 1 [Ooceraea biroi]XP_011341070.1 S1 RNA-binding domain-containing protein 1 [Ooceraea biroi]EZA52895.1 S1 RNA-binding domain-containing protein [Ooceraea biroi]RLU17281.1 hypothetical protein DMN91_011350 [Ooceraea biroi]